MALKLVTYELSDTSFGQRIVDSVRKMGRWVRLSEGALVVDTELPTDKVFTRLLTQLDKEDRIYVLELSRHWSGYGEMDVNAFLAEGLRPSQQGAGLPLD